MQASIPTPDAAVEALAKVVVEEGAYGVPWGDASDGDREDALEKARDYLEAAAPHLLTVSPGQQACLVALEADIDGELQDAEPSNYEEDNYDAGYIAGLTYAQDLLRAALTASEASK